MSVDKQDRDMLGFEHTYLEFEHTCLGFEHTCWGLCIRARVCAYVSALYVGKSLACL